MESQLKVPTTAPPSDVRLYTTVAAFETEADANIATAARGRMSRCVFFIVVIVSLFFPQAGSEPGDGMDAGGGRC